MYLTWSNPCFAEMMSDSSDNPSDKSASTNSDSVGSPSNELHSEGSEHAQGPSSFENEERLEDVHRQNNRKRKRDESVEIISSSKSVETTSSFERIKGYLDLYNSEIESAISNTDTFASRYVLSNSQFDLTHWTSAVPL